MVTLQLFNVILADVELFSAGRMAPIKKLQGVKISFTGFLNGFVFTSHIVYVAQIFDGACALPRLVSSRVHTPDA